MFSAKKVCKFNDINFANFIHILHNEEGAWVGAVWSKSFPRQFEEMASLFGSKCILNAILQEVRNFLGLNPFEGDSTKESFIFGLFLN